VTEGTTAYLSFRVQPCAGIFQVKTLGDQTFPSSFSSEAELCPLAKWGLVDYHSMHVQLTKTQ